MGTVEQPYAWEHGDALIDEVRGLRRALCEQFGHDVERLVEHLRGVEAEYAARRGVFACVTKTGAAKVVESWGDAPYHTDDPLVDEVREIRHKLAEKR